ncbi:MAG: hypothetical protein FD153_1564 [Rhodospirillaceae bacterium]|nr:MAG: hypothetical protein FD153_1564 [Rhodospirillaceae bacterium]
MDKPLNILQFQIENRRMTQDLSSIDLLAQAEAFGVPLTVAVFFGVTMIALVVAVLAWLFRLVRQLQRIGTPMGDIHRDLISFKNAANMNRAIDSALTEIRTFVYMQWDGIACYLMEMREVLAKRKASPAAPLLEPPGAAQVHEIRKA